MASDEARGLLHPLSPRVGKMPLVMLNDDMRLDDEEATMVLVFPRGKDAGGIVDCEEVITDPLNRCKPIFFRHRNPHSWKAIEEELGPLFKDKIVTAAHYQQVVRDKVLHLLQETGVHASTFDSIDRDEIFVKLSLDRQGEVVRRIAQRYEYKVPFKHEAYRDMPHIGRSHNQVPGQPMRNSNDRPVPAYTEFQCAMADQLQPFGDLDEIRLLHTHLDMSLHMDEMLKQNILTRVFPSIKYEKIMQVYNDWGSLSHIMTIPTSSTDDMIRSYFGETVAFFFRWYAFYIRMLKPLAWLGCLIAIVRLVSCMAHITIPTVYMRYSQMAFAVIMAGWASVFNRLFRRSAARVKQRWGLKDTSLFEPDHVNFKEELEGTWRQYRKTLFANIITVLFCVLFVASVVKLELVREEQRRNGNQNYQKYGGPVATVLLIKVVSKLWAMFVPSVVNLENHRTLQQWNNSLTLKLASVKLFVALFPFLNLAFGKSFFDRTCMQGVNNTALANELFGLADTWPILTHVDGNTTRLNGSDLTWLQPYIRHYSDNTSCIDGCYPSDCFMEQDNVILCTSSCIHSLLLNLGTFYVTHIFTTIFLILAPILLIIYEIRKETSKVAQQSDNEGYSLLQYQGKCAELADYEYYSWGGSQVEDFLELAIAFALMTSFNIMLPGMTFAAFISHVVEYRLLAYRMTLVTSRPLPASADGIGNWQTVFEVICGVAGVINVGLAVFVLNQNLPGLPSQQGTSSKIFSFVILEHFMLLLGFFVSAAIPPEPEDVRRIEEFNSRFRLHAKKYPVIVPPAERQSLMHLDLGVGTKQNWRLENVLPCEIVDLHIDPDLINHQIGAELCSARDGAVIVERLLPEHVKRISGHLQAGDEIVSVQGTPTEGREAQEVHRIVRQRSLEAASDNGKLVLGIRRRCDYASSGVNLL